jgi:EAL domain-containing protein (putative c-di-GMP-specific phosphodiesterase class I)
MPRTEDSARTVIARRAMALPRPALALLIGSLLGLCWAVVTLAGGTASVLFPLFAVPIVLAAVRFASTGTLVTAIAAAVLAGPAMIVGPPHTTADWLTRGVLFVVIAGASSAGRHALEAHHAHDVCRRLRDGLTEITVTGARIEFDSSASDGGDAPIIDAILRDHRFRPVFQPIYGLADGDLVAVEALTRFDDDPDTPPNVWFTRADRVGRGVELEIAAIDAALERSRLLPPDVTVSLNCSPATVADARLTGVLDEHRERAVYVEVTEHALVEDYRELTSAIAMLRRRGVQVAVDDAGAGFSSFRHLVRLEPEIIKLDRSVTASLRTDPVRRALAGSFIDFARRTGSQLVAEGVEEPGDLLAWRELGAHAAQGYLLGRPGPLDVAPPAESRRHPLLCREAS